MEAKEKPMCRGHRKVNMFMMPVPQQYTERKINNGFHKIQKIDTVF